MMFQVQQRDDSRLVRVIIFGLLVANLLASAITVWIMIEVRKEQVVFADLLAELRRESDDLASSTLEITSELRWQYGLTAVVLLNIVGTGLAVVALSRAYLLSQRTLRSVKELAGNILASMDHAVITLDTHGFINGINPKGREMLGIRDEELQVRLSQLSTALKPLVELDEAIQRLGENIRDRAFPFSVNGQTLRLLSHGHLLKNERGATIGTVLHVTDITEQSLLEERMRRMERFAGLGAVAAGLAHEIKNPLSALVLHVQLLKEQLEHVPVPETDETIKILLSEVRRMTKVLDGFREFAAIDKLDRQPISLAGLVDKVVGLLKPHIHSKGIPLNMEIETPPDLLVHVDSVKIEQVLINLILNALEAMSRGDALTLRCEADDDNMRISVSDTGTGIPESIRDKLFDPYFTTKNHGSGLGLAICEKIVRQHEGTISFETSGRGTTFRLVVPRSPLTEKLRTRKRFHHRG